MVHIDQTWKSCIGKLRNDLFYNQQEKQQKQGRENISKEDLLILKYEDLVCDLAGNLTRICEFIGEEFDESMLDLAAGTRHLVNGNNTMFKRSSGVKFDERWKTDLLEDDLEWFMERAAKLNQALGYKKDYSMVYYEYHTQIDNGNNSCIF